jgi:hypothetical protein
MRAYKIDKIIQKDGVLSLNGLPFQSGEEVEIIILKNDKKTKKHILKNKVLKYDRPFEPVADNDWDVEK